MAEDWIADSYLTWTELSFELAKFELNSEFKTKTSNIRTSLSIASKYTAKQVEA